MDFFRGVHSWRKLATLLEQLPAGSRLWAARADDDEAARAWLEATKGSKKRPPARPSLADMSFGNQLLMEVVDGQRALVARLDALLGEDGKATPMLRPLTAIERVEARSEWDEHDDLSAEVAAAQERWAATKELNRE